MPKDIRKMFENYPEESGKLSSSHANAFENKLMKELHTKESKQKTYKWLSIAASVALLVSIAIQFYPSETTVDPIPSNDIQTKEISLGSLSPELKSIESYYVNSINFEISNLDVNDSNKEILDGYLVKVGELTTEYKSLTKELNTKGVNDEIINALINNLQLRLQLLQRLKKQLNNLKNLNSTQNEPQIS